MRIRFTERFRRSYGELTPSEQESVEKALRLLASDWRYPSLRVKKMQGRPGIWEARASQSLRITFEISGDVILLRNVGQHDKTLDNP